MTKDEITTNMRDLHKLIVKIYEYCDPIIALKGCEIDFNNRQHLLIIDALHLLHHSFTNICNVLEVNFKEKQNDTN